MVTFQEVFPTAISKCGGVFSGADNVREHDRCEHTISLVTLSDAGQELLNFAHKRIHVANPRQVVDSLQLYVLGVRNALSHISAAADIHECVVLAVKDQSGHPDRRKEVPDVDFYVHSVECHGRSRARSQPKVLCPPAAETLVIRDAWRKETQSDRLAPFL